MYAVIHGGVDHDLRKYSINYLTSLPFDGFGIGGSLGSCFEELVELLDFMMPMMPRDYLATLIAHHLGHEPCRCQILSEDMRSLHHESPGQGVTIILCGRGVTMKALNDIQPSKSAAGPDSIY